ncbi:MAG: glycosyltransferase family 2 protein, partial [Lachnospiraceae bacterium]
MQNNKDYISIIIPVNGKEYFSQQIVSIIKQSYKSKEIIIICNGIERKTKEFFLDCENMIRIVCCNHKNAGEARNIGLLHATGKYVVFLDSDDFFCPDMLERAYKKMEEEKLDLCIWNVWEYDNESGLVYDDTTHLRPELLPDKNIFSGEEAEYILNITSGATWNKMYSRQFLLDNHLQYMEQKFFNDIYFVQTALVHAKRISVIKDELMYYRINNKESLQANKERGIGDLPKAFVQTYNRFQEDNLYNGTVRTSFLNYILSCSMAILKDNMTDSAYEKFLNFVKQSEIYREISIDDVHYYQKELFDDLQYAIENPTSEVKARLVDMSDSNNKKVPVKQLECCYP